ncbi:hypothetical protein [Actinocorallia longicatena]|uniref:Uncharacterized protein n=1 Tax=Actinocorallia longicatena TaxID=111803 RepID=A0ABP6QJH3_9ACTN
MGERRREVRKRTVVRFPGVRHRYVVECRKIGFSTEKAAAAALSQVERRVARGLGDAFGRSPPASAYSCGTCGGWHLTSRVETGTGRTPVWLVRAGVPEGEVARARRRGARLVAGREREIAEFVDAYLRQHSRGPRWSEVRARFAWRSDAQTMSALVWLGLNGWILFTPAERSLRPGPRWTAPR